MFSIRDRTYYFRDYYFSFERTSSISSKLNILQDFVAVITFNKLSFMFFHTFSATVYGKGVYFAVSASYSDEYAERDRQGDKRMFQARVLTGRYCTGAGRMKVPPTRDSKNQILYDSVVNNVDAPDMFVIFNDTQAYPEYLITYR